jgi:hypothetical protein
MNKNLPTYSELIQKSWDSIKSDLLLAAALTAIMLAGVAGLAQIPFVGWILASVVTTGYIACLLKMKDRKEFNFEDFLWACQPMNRLLNVIILGALKGVIIVVGFLFFVIPGIYAMIAFSLSDPILVRDNTDAVTSLKKSKELAQGRWWYLAGLSSVIFLLNILGGLCFLLGVLFSIPVSVLMVLHLLDSLQSSETVASPASAGPSILSVNPIH